MIRIKNKKNNVLFIFLTILAISFLPCNLTGAIDDVDGDIPAENADNRGNAQDAIPTAHARTHDPDEEHIPGLRNNPLNYGFVRFNEGSIRLGLKPALNFTTVTPHDFSIEGIKKATEKGILSAIGETTSSLLSHVLLRIIVGGANKLKSMFPSKPSQEELLKHAMLIQQQNIIQKEQAESEIKIKGEIVRILKEQYEASGNSSKTAEEKREREILRAKLNIANEEYANTSLAYLLATRKNNSQHSSEEEEATAAAA